MRVRQPVNRRVLPLRGLPELVRLELVYASGARTAKQVTVVTGGMRPWIDQLRSLVVASVTEFNLALLEGVGDRHHERFARFRVDVVSLAGADPDAERTKDVWSAQFPTQFQPWGSMPRRPGSKAAASCFREARELVAAPVLRDLMDHRSLLTTLGYYRVGDARKRAAIELLARHTVDSRGLARSVEQPPSALTHLGESLACVAVLMGKCSAPTNARAGGLACPIRYQCAACPHLKSDPSYLPELRAYADELRREQEAMLAADAPAWSVDHVARQLEVVLGHVHIHEAALTELEAAERIAIEEASTTLRQRLARQLGAEADAARGLALAPALDELEQRDAELEAENHRQRDQIALTWAGTRFGAP